MDAHPIRRAAWTASARPRLLATTLLTLAIGALAGCATAADGPAAGARAASGDGTARATSALSPGPFVRSCPSNAPADYAAQPPSLAFTVDPVALLAGAPSLCGGLTGNSPCAEHHVYVPNAAVVPREPLVVFLPGTNMEPDKHDLVLQTAAYAGYRTIGLAYDNVVSTESACAAFPNCGSNCEGPVHNEVVLGVNVSAQRAVRRGDSVLERLYRALDHLNGIDPGGGWSSYYVPTAGNITASNIVWSNVIVAGFSQGAGHAAAISHSVQVHGLVVLDGANETCLDAAGNPVPADWIGLTPDASAGRPKYGVHHRYGLPAPMAVPDAWVALGISSAGNSADLDAAWVTIPPARSANTDQLAPAAPAICSSHMSMARDSCMPIDTSSGTAAVTPPDAHLFGGYLWRFCYACDAATCP